MNEAQLTASDSRVPEIVNGGDGDVAVNGGPVVNGVTHTS
ncbi:hypothetical protein Tco_1366841, partial [Tanacetum coccineum]